MTNIQGLLPNEFSACVSIIQELYEDAKTQAASEAAVEIVSLYTDIADRLVKISRVPTVFIFREDKRLELMDLIFQDPVFAQFYLTQASTFFARVSADSYFLLRLAYNLSQAIYMKESIYQLIPDINKASMLLTAEEIEGMFNNALNDDLSGERSDVNKLTPTEKLCHVLESNRLLLYSILVNVALNIYFVQTK